MRIAPKLALQRAFVTQALLALLMAGCGVSGNVTSNAAGVAGGSTATAVAGTSGATSASASSTTHGTTSATGATTSSRATTTGRSTSAAAASSGQSATTSGNTATSAAASTTSGATTTGPASSTTSGATTTGPSATTTGPSATTSGSSTAGASTSGASSTTGGFVGVLQRSNDLARDAVYANSAFQKSVISTSGTLQVNSSFNSPTWTGPVFASPLYFVNPTLGKDEVIVVTGSNEVYALDAADGSVIWSIAQLVSPIDTTNSSVTGLFACSGSGVLGDSVGITGTPVIDPATRTLYFDALTLAGSTPDHQIYALNLDNGNTVAGWPVHANNVSTVLTDGTTFQFKSADQWQRGALTLVNGTLYVSYGGINGDCGNYHGWVIAVDTAKPTTVTAYATDVHQAGIWGPSGPASDGTSIYVATGNGDSSQESSAWLEGEALLRLGAGATFSNQSTDFFYPTNYVTLDDNDEDLGSTEPVLFDFNDARTGLRHLIWEMGKTDTAILLDRDNLGGAEGELSAPYVLPINTWLFGTYAAYTTNGSTYVIYNGGYQGTCPHGSSGDTTAMLVSPSTATAPITATVAWCGSFGAAAPIVSTTDGTTDAVVWGLGNGQLSARDGVTGAQLASVSVPQSLEHWISPIIAKGRLFVAGDNGASAFLP